MIRIARVDRGAGVPRGYRVEVTFECDRPELVMALMDAAREMDGDVETLHALAQAALDLHAKVLSARMREEPGDEGSGNA